MEQARNTLTTFIFGWQTGSLSLSPKLELHHLFLHLMFSEHGLQQGKHLELFHSAPSLLKNTTLQFFHPIKSLACHITGIYQLKCSLDCLQSRLTDIVTFGCGSTAYIQSPQFIQFLNTPNSSSIFMTCRFTGIKRRSIPHMKLIKWLTLTNLQSFGTLRLKNKVALR